MTSSPGGRSYQPAPYPTAGWDLGRLRLHAPARPLVMGIVNLTPDSFHGASRHRDPDAAVDAALVMLQGGADMLDLGAESTRPGATAVSAAEEQDRLLPVLAALRAETDAPLSVDTRRPETARLALASGADAINDVGGGQAEGMLELVAEHETGLVIMHMQGDPATMQTDPRYDDPLAEVRAWLAARVQAAGDAGIPPSRVMIDPGIGFGKLLEHNLALLASLRKISGSQPLLLGASRKSFIGHLTGAAVADRLGGSLAAVAVAYAHGATMVRVHDVAETVQFLDVLAAIAEAAEPE